MCSAGHVRPRGPPTRDVLDVPHGAGRTSRYETVPARHRTLCGSSELVLRSNLAALGPDALCELEDVLTWPQPPRDALSRSLVDRPNAEPLAQQSRSRTPTTWRACVCSER